MRLASPAVGPFPVIGLAATGTKLSLLGALRHLNDATGLSGFPLVRINVHNRRSYETAPMSLNFSMSSLWKPHSKSISDVCCPGSGGGI